MRVKAEQNSGFVAKVIAVLVALGVMVLQANADVIDVSSYSFTPAAAWDDSTGVELTDGNYGVGGNTTVVGWYNQSSATITFDLGDTYDVHEIVLTGTSAWSGGGGIASVDISVSLDGVNFIDLTNFGGSYTGSPFTRTLDVSGLGNAHYVRVTLNGSTWMMLSEVDFDGIVAGSDTTPPTLAGSDIVDDKTGGPVLEGETVTYTLTFSEAMKVSSVDTNDFENASATALSVESVSTTADPAVFEVAVTPLTAGTLQLQVKAGAVLEDPSGNPLDTAAAISDDTTITVNTDNVAPTLDSFADDVDGVLYEVGSTAIYTVVFSEAMDAATIGPADFRNAGSPAATINSVTATGDPAVYEVSVSPGGAGTLQLQVKAGANLEDLFGNPLDTSSAITDPTVITVLPGAGGSYKADIAPYPAAPWDDAGGDPTAPGGVAWADSELFDGIIETTGNNNVVGWYEARDGAPTLTFDLGAMSELQSIDVWRRVGNGTVTDLTISVSTDNTTYSTPVAYTPATWSSDQATIDLSAFADSRYVRVKLGPDGVGGGWLMLTEVEFDATPVLPAGTLILIH